MEHRVYELIFAKIAHSCVVAGTMGALTQTPENVVGLNDGGTYTLQCSSDRPRDIIWIHNSRTIVGHTCSSSDLSFTTIKNNDITECHLIIEGKGTSLYGPFTCSGLSAGENAKAVVVIIGQ